MAEHITIQSTIPRIRYIADGMLTTFEFPFAIFKDSDLKVYFGETLQNSGYTVSGANNSDGGSVTFASAPAADTIITLTRSLAIERISDFQEGGALRANVLNSELDYQIACLQEVADNLNRSMVLPPYAVGTDINLTLPAPAAGKAIVWNEQGTNLENSTVAVNELESTLAGYKTAAETAKDDAVTAKNAAIGKADEAASFASTASTKASEAAASASAAAASASSVASSLSTKANKDMDNLTTTGKSNIVELRSPDYTRGSSVSVNSTFTPTTDGVIEYKVYVGTGGTKNFYIHEDNASGRKLSGLANDASGYIHLAAQLRVNKGKTYYITSTGATIEYITFYPCKGE